jgi:hypothetical protein
LGGKRFDVGFQVRRLAGVVWRLLELVQRNEQDGAACGDGVIFLLGHGALLFGQGFERSEAPRS